MEYTRLEKKIVEKGLKEFRKELQDASVPMLEVLEKYGIKHNHELLKKITLSYPYGSNLYEHHAVSIPNDDKELECIEGKILDNFMKEVEELKSRIDNLQID
jgi:hypothetical protein